jgi:short-subunit dehydrogenase
MKKILIIGATSAIANSCAKILANKDSQFLLVARNPEKLKQIADDLKVRGSSSVESFVADMNDFSLHQEILQKIDHIDIALIAHGTLPDQKSCEENAKTALQEFSSNGLSVISFLTLLANKMEVQKCGTIAVISSVAGDRGRASNYLYGSAKAAVTAFCSGLRSRLCKNNVHLLTIKPGFVDTPMTKNLSLPKALVATSDKVAQDICTAIEKKSDSIYTPKFWFLIMLIIRNIPEKIFKKLKL